MSEAGEVPTTIDEVEHLRAWVLAASDLVKAVNVERPVGSLLTKVAEQARSLLGLDMCAVMMADEAGSRLVIEGSSGLSERYVERLHAEQPLLVGREDGGDPSPPSVEAYLSGRTVVIPDIRQSVGMERWRQLAVQEGFGYEALIATPLRDGEQIAGVIVGYSLTRRTFPSSQVDMLSLFAVQAGTALQAARLRDGSKTMIKELNAANAELRRQRQRLEVMDQQHRRLMQVMANDVGVSGVVTMLAELLEASVTVEDPQGGVVATTTRGTYVPPPRNSERDSPLVAAALQQISASRAGSVEVERREGSGYRFWVAPVTLANEVVAHLWVGGQGLELDDIGRLGIERFALAVALELSKQRNAMQIRLRLSRDLMADLLSEIKVADRPGLLERADAMGHDLRVKHQVLVARLDPGPRPPRQGLLEVADAAVRQHIAGTIVGSHGGDVVLLVPYAYPPAGVAVAHRLRREFNRRNPGCTASVAVGPTFTDIADIARHFRATQGALRLIGHRRSEAVVEIGALGVGSLLLSHGDPDALRRFAEGLIEPLEQRDDKRRADLIKTLRCWIEEDCSTSRTAERLIVHPNTVSYRLKTVEELLGRSLRSPALLVDLDIALMIHDVLGESNDS